MEPQQNQRQKTRDIPPRNRAAGRRRGLRERVEDTRGRRKGVKKVEEKGARGKGKE